MKILKFLLLVILFTYNITIENTDLEKTDILVSGNVTMWRTYAKLSHLET